MIVCDLCGRVKKLDGVMQFGMYISNYKFSALFVVSFGNLCRIAVICMAIGLHCEVALRQCALRCSTVLRVCLAGSHYTGVMIVIDARLLLF